MRGNFIIVCLFLVAGCTSSFQKEEISFSNEGIYYQYNGLPYHGNTIHGQFIKEQEVLSFLEAKGIDTKSVLKDHADFEVFNVQEYEPLKIISFQFKRSTPKTEQRSLTFAEINGTYTQLPLPTNKTPFFFHDQLGEIYITANRYQDYNIFHLKDGLLVELNGPQLANPNPTKPQPLAQPKLYSDGKEWYMVSGYKFYKIEQGQYVRVSGMEDLDQYESKLGSMGAHSNDKGDWYVEGDIRAGPGDHFVFVYSVKDTQATRISGIDREGYSISLYSNEQGEWMAKTLTCQGTKCVGPPSEYAIGQSSSKKIRNFKGKLCYHTPIPSQTWCSKSSSISFGQDYSGTRRVEWINVDLLS